jgi:AhpD family alkylhydroperoxidase
MTHFTVYGRDNAPEASAAHVERSQREWGFVPTLHGILAESAPVLDAYQTLFALGQKTGFTPAEQQLIYIAISAFHECEYCVAGHTYLARMSKLEESAIQSLRNGTPIADAKLQALRVFVEGVVRERGFVGDAAVATFLKAGYTTANVLEVTLFIATKTISNYVNHIAHTPHESFMSDPALSWNAPRNRVRAA